MEATQGYPQGDTSAEVIINLRTRGNFLQLILAWVLLRALSFMHRLLSQGNKALIVYKPLNKQKLAQYIDNQSAS
jgi:hypothetical protein